MLVSLEEALGLRSRGRAARELLVESDNPLHARGVSGTANGLFLYLSAFRRLPTSILSSACSFQVVRRGIGCAFDCSSGGSEENGRGLRRTYVGRGDLYKLSARFMSITIEQRTFGGTRVETMIAVYGYGWGG